MWGGAAFVPSDEAPADDLADGAAYDPGTDTWRPLPEADLDLSLHELIWTGSQVIVWGGQSFSGPEFGNLRGNLLSAAYDPTTDDWTTFPAGPLSTQAADAAWTGRGLLATNYSNEAALLDPVAGTWARLPETTMRECEGFPTVGALGTIALTGLCGDMTELDLASLAWEPVELGQPDDWYPTSWRTAGGSAATFGSAWTDGFQGGEAVPRLWVYVPQR